MTAQDDPPFRSTFVQWPPLEPRFRGSTACGDSRTSARTRIIYHELLLTPKSFGIADCLLNSGLVDRYLQQQSTQPCNLRNSDLAPLVD